MGLLPGCVLPSQSLGAGDSTTDDPSSSGGDATTGGNACAPTSEFDCTHPYDLGFGPCGGLDFDESCCMRPSCASANDCAPGEACVPVGVAGLECHDEGDQCLCMAPVDGFQRNVCLPPELIPDEWCGGFLDEASCNGAEHVYPDGPEGADQFCKWIEVHELSIVDESTCSVYGPEPRCLTIRYSPEAGCVPAPCASADLGIVLQTAIGRFIDAGTTIEVFGLNDYFCGGGAPVGDWLLASDPSFGACAMSCGFENPCAMTLAEWVAIQADYSEDAPVDDCGDLHLDDPLADWQAAHDCAVQHAMATQGFQLVAEGQGLDSIVTSAFVGRQGATYEVLELHADMGLGDYALYQRTGDGLSDVGDCSIAVGELCLTAANAGPDEQLCPE